MTWDFAPVFDAAHRAALENEKPFVYVCPPAGWPLVFLFQALPERKTQHLDTLVLAPGIGDVLEAAAAVTAAEPHRPVHPLTGLGRSESLIRADSVATLIATPADAHHLLKRSVLRSGGLVRVALLWPERLDDAGAAYLETLLADAGDAQRLVVTTDQAAASSFIERYARRAPVGVQSDLPETGAGAVRYAVVESHARVRAARTALDILLPRKALIWDPTGTRRWDLLSGPDLGVAGDGADSDLVIAAELPSPEALRVFGEGGREVVVFLRASQLPYLQRITSSAKPLRLPGYADRARADAATLRETLRTRLQQGNLATELLAIEPLLETFDPALIAAAALSLSRGSSAAPTPEDQETPAAPRPTWTRVFVTAGQRDNVRPGDILGAFISVAKLSRGDVGRIDVRERFSLVDVQSEVAEQVIRCITGEQIRGRRVTARLDRHE
ncbi:MAG: DbpA RNA binding domain-containing protein [Gemmatimonadetes bacterium]|nr:DbpA RNA binding domain-containing protein [Gemmatimonadota bacterium]